MKVNIQKLAALAKRANNAAGAVGAFAEEGVRKMRAIAGGGAKPASLMGTESTGAIPMAPPPATRMWELITGKPASSGAKLQRQKSASLMAEYLGVIEKYASRRCVELEKTALYMIERS